MATMKGMISKMDKIMMLWLLMVVFGYFERVKGYKAEYCSSQSFAPQCNNNEVVVMKHALYGRMQKGKCLKTNNGLGCETNVLHVLDDICSNHESCNFVVHVQLESVENPCPLDMFRYLEADYACEQVLQLDYTQCRATSTQFDVTSKLSVSSKILSEANCGSSSLQFTARPGQQLNISIIDFNSNQHQNSRHSCVNYLELSEPETGKKQPVCAGSYDRTGHVMLTSGHDVTAVFHVQDPNNQRFILTLEAVGCGDITPPKGTWVQREGDETTLGCHSGRHSWTLKCENDQWVGAVGSCGTAVVVHPKATHVPEKQKWNIATGMVIFAVFSALLFVCSSTFSIGVCFYAKGHKKEANYLPTRYQPQTLPLSAHSRQPSSNIPNNQLFIEEQQLMQERRDTQPEIPENTNRPPKQKETEQMYCNTNTLQSQSDSMYSDSVKYYVLENIRQDDYTATKA